jgi:hypothetical protein
VAGVENGAIRSEERDRVPAVLDEGSEPPVRGSNLVLGPLALGGVGRVPAHDERVALVMHAHRRREPSIGPVAMTEPELVLSGRGLRGEVTGEPGVDLLAFLRMQRGDPPTRGADDLLRFVSEHRLHVGADVADREVRGVRLEDQHEAEADDRVDESMLSPLLRASRRRLGSGRRGIVVPRADESRPRLRTAGGAVDVRISQGVPHVHLRVEGVAGDAECSEPIDRRGAFANGKRPAHGGRKELLTPSNALDAGAVEMQRPE